MFLPILIATLQAAPVKIVDVSTTRNSGALTVQVSGEGLLSVDGVKGRVDGHSLRLTLPDTAIEKAEKMFGHSVRARKKGESVELKIPISHKSDCLGPVHFEASSAGLSASVKCTEHVASEESDEPKAIDLSALPRILETQSAQAGTMREPATRPSTLPMAKRSDPVPMPVPGEKAIMAPVVAAPRPVTGMGALIASRKAESTSSASSTTKSESTTTKTESAKTESAKTESAKTESAKTETAKPASPVLAIGNKSDKIETLSPVAATASSSSEMGARTMIAPIVVLGLLAGAALFLRRKQVKTTRMMRILETTNIGPKRSLIVAQVGNETMLLATSEAGITMLSKLPSGVATFATSATQAAIPAIQPANDAHASPLASAAADLFKKFSGGSRSEEPETASFELLLEEAAEDEILRRKLNQGIAGRV